jgi:hypothetical protein
VNTKGHASDAYEIGSADTRTAMQAKIDKSYPFAIYSGVSMNCPSITIGHVNGSVSPNEYHRLTSRQFIMAHDYMRAMNLESVTPLYDMVYQMADVYIVPRVGLIIVWDNNVSPCAFLNHKRYSA